MHLKWKRVLLGFGPPCNPKTKNKRERVVLLTCYYIWALRLPLLVHPSWTWIEYCKFQRTLSMEGRLLGSLLRQLTVISTVVFNDWYAKLPCIDGSMTPLSFDGPSIKPFSNCSLKDAKNAIELGVARTQKSKNNKLGFFCFLFFYMVYLNL